jgi:hypothetical protein
MYKEDDKALVMVKSQYFPGEKKLMLMESREVCSGHPGPCRSFCTVCFVQKNQIKYKRRFNIKLSGPGAIGYRPLRHSQYRCR